MAVEKLEADHAVQVYNDTTKTMVVLVVILIDSEIPLVVAALQIRVQCHCCLK
ncbi:OLC1v1038065C1 [Oldenlandia corymbosa var. corymbosa]|uniref:OLC1v1038065C1 n=1 Tax=Oldenlandia corymbosa var. corymbosa TaxID=529605 RepID=A0AAV1D048_OLDCO|nr:OLC1v1038065C1 [Oldenlandia corymbosa var. corymbosa]